MEEGETLWTTMAAISFLTDGLIVWLYFKLITPFCMIVSSRYGSTRFCYWTLVLQYSISGFIISLLSTYICECDRGYKDSKLSNNIECEIFQVLLEEAKESYSEEKVIAMKSDNIEDISRNVATLTDWVRNWSLPSQS